MWDVDIGKTMKRYTEPFRVELLRTILNYSPDLGRLFWKVSLGTNVKPGDMAGTINSHNYMIVTYRGKKIPAHRLAWALVYGEWPKAEIDHIDGNRTNNRIENLRLATHSENMFNTALRTTNTSGHRGVRKVNRGAPWRAFIHDGTGRQVSLGSYETFEEAVAARKQAEENLKLKTR